MQNTRLSDSSLTRALRSLRETALVAVSGSTGLSNSFFVREAWAREQAQRLIDRSEGASSIGERVQVSVDGEILKPEEYTFSAVQGKSTAGSDYIGSANSMLDASTTTSITLESDRFIGAEKIVVVPSVTVSGKTWSYLQAGEAYWSDLPWVQDSGFRMEVDTKCEGSHPGRSADSL